MNFAGQINLPSSKNFYIYRTEETEERDSGCVSIRKIHFGPFPDTTDTDKVFVKKILNSIRTFNKLNSGRGMNLHIISNQPKSGTQQVKSVDIVYGDTCTYRQEQKITSHGNKPYEWMIGLIASLCSDILQEYKLHNFYTNIDHISDAFDDPEIMPSKSDFIFADSDDESDSDSESDDDADLLRLNAIQLDDDDDDQDKPATKPIVVTKPEPKPIVVTKPEPKPIVVTKPETKPIVVTKPETKPASKPIVAQSIPQDKKKMSKEDVQAAIKAKKDAKLAEELALKTQKEALKILSKNKSTILTPDISRSTPTQNKSKSGFLPRHDLAVSQYDDDY